MTDLRIGTQYADYMIHNTLYMKRAYMGSTQVFQSPPLLIRAGTDDATFLFGAGWGATNDVLIVFAFRDGSNSAPTNPSGWTSIASAGANTCSYRISRRVLSSGDASSGFNSTFTNATQTVFVLLRGHDYAITTGATQASGASALTFVYPATTLQVTDGRSVVLCFAGHRNVVTGYNTPPTGTKLAAAASGSSSVIAAFITSQPALRTTWAEQTVSLSGTASGRYSVTLEIRPT